MSSTKQVHGTGSIVALEKGKDGKKKERSKCRRWRLVVSLGRDPKSKEKRYRQKSRNVQGTYTEAQRELRKFIEELESGDVVLRSTWTYNDYAEHFIEARKASGKFAERTISSNRYELASLGRLVGNLKMQDITPEILEQAYADLRSGTNDVKRPIGGTRLFNINRTAFLMFMDAERKGVIAHNPLFLVDKPKKDTKPKRALPADRYRKLLAELDPEVPYQLAVLLCASLGLRRGESLAVSWGDVDFGDRTVAVYTSCTESAELKDPKTESGLRLLPLADFLAGQLMARKARQVSEFLVRNPKLVVKVESSDAAELAGLVEVDGAFYDLAPEAPLVCDVFGERLKPHTFSVWWTRHSADFGIPGWTLHELRHTFLSAAAAEGVHPAVMQQLAGHKSAGTTMGIYTHVNMTSKRSAIETLQAAYT